jgi:curved DNA-binding protein CbpA
VAATSAFQKIVRAYEILSDPVARAAVDRRLHAQAGDEPAGAQPSPRRSSSRGPVPSGWPDARRAPPAARAGEGVTPVRRDDARAPAEAASTRRDERGGGPARPRAPGVMLARLSGPLNALTACGIARRLGPDRVELRVSDDEARTGGMIAISLRVDARCGRCHGADPACVASGGTGTTDELFSAWLALPPGVADGTLLEPSAQLPGVVQRVHFRVRRCGWR